MTETLSSNQNRHHSSKHYLTDYTEYATGGGGNEEETEGNSNNKRYKPADFISSSSAARRRYTEYDDDTKGLVSIKTSAAGGGDGWGGGSYPAMGSGAAPFVSRSMDGGFPSSVWNGQASATLGGLSNGTGNNDIYVGEPTSNDDSDDPSVIPHHYLLDNGISERHEFPDLPNLLKRFGFMRTGLVFTYARRSHSKSNPAEILMPIQLVNMLLREDGLKPFGERKFPFLASVLNSFRLVGPQVALTDNPNIYVNQQLPQFNTASATALIAGWTETPNHAFHSEYSYRTGSKHFHTVRKIKIGDGSLECFQFEANAVDNNYEMMSEQQSAASSCDGTIGAVLPFGYINGNATYDSFYTIRNPNDKKHELLLCPTNNNVEFAVQEQGYLPKIFVCQNIGFVRHLGLWRNRFDREPLNCFTASQRRFHSSY